ncbi:MAG: multidrug ABC transporter substrate-binding protein [Gammaproteobacteria bacterium SG8_47]|nr:MAG: multidrug ABC transporter substrate-binding protein [Gammaproteobacteria bacterium SG8_47]
MLWNSLLLALREIRRNVLRSFLTVLGIVIGVAAVIIMVTLGAGATAKVSDQIASLGSNLLMVRPGQRLGMGMRSAASAFDSADVDALARDIRNVAAVAPSSTAAVTAVYGNANWSTAVTGVDNAYFTVRRWQITQGRQFTDGELRAGSAVCIIGATVRQELFGAQDPIDSRIRLKKMSCQIIGLLETKGESTFGRDQDDLVLVPLRTFQRRIAGSQDIDMIQVSIEEGASTEHAKQDIQRLLRERRHISAAEDDDFNVTDMKEIAKTLTGTTRILTTLLGAVAAVSLLVGGIGIMNIMLVSVTERTREIGIRLAIGALEREVLTQFLVEAVVLSSFGGLFGIVVALVASLSLVDIMQVPFVFDPSIVVIAFLFSVAVGIIFGFFPARRAARMDPIEALRHE